jgi:hypothetical protein
VAGSSLQDPNLQAEAIYALSCLVAASPGMADMFGSTPGSAECCLKVSYAAYRSATHMTLPPLPPKFLLRLYLPCNSPCAHFYSRCCLRRLCWPPVSVVLPPTRCV